MRDERGAEVVFVEFATEAEDADRFSASRPFLRDVVTNERLRGKLGACGVRYGKRRRRLIDFGTCVGCAVDEARPRIESKDPSDQGSDRVGG